MTKKLTISLPTIITKSFIKITFENGVTKSINADSSSYRDIVRYVTTNMFTKIYEALEPDLDNLDMLDTRKIHISIIRKVLTALRKDDKELDTAFKDLKTIYEANKIKPKSIIVKLLTDILKFHKDKSNKDGLNREENCKIKCLYVMFSQSDYVNMKFKGTSVDVKNGCVRYKKKYIRSNAICKHILESMKNDVDPKVYVNFLNNVMKNPNEEIQKELFLFLENGKFPIHSDGTFSAYKIISHTWTDKYTGKIDHSIGAKPKMERSECDSIRTNTCSTGLHFCAYDYLQSYGDPNHDKVVEVKINPKNVVAIPNDYNNMKGRCMTYEIIQELDYSQGDVLYKTTAVAV